MEPPKALLASPFSLVLIFFLAISLNGEEAASEDHHVTPHVGPVVEWGHRRTLIVTEYGEISSIDIKDGRAPPYHLQFFTLEPNSLFLPVLLHVDMIFYVHTGSGRLTWADEDGTRRIDLREGDLCKLSEGSVFYIQSNLEAERKKLRIYAILVNTDVNTYDPSIGAYSRINDLVKGFDKKIIQAAFKVPGDLIEAITNKTDTPAIVHAVSEQQHTFWELEALFLKNFLGMRANVKKVKTYNIFDKDPDFKNSNGWSLTVTKKQLKSLKGTNTGFLMVNLTMGSMLGPHWNPRATEIAVVLQGEGMVRVVCGSSNNDKTEEECQNRRFKVKEGDLFAVPRFHPMAQMSFNNDSLVFLGFSTTAKQNYPQFLAGKRSVLQVLDRQMLATSFGVSNTTIDQLVASQDDSIIFGCVSCAEEEERIMKEGIEEEEERRREEEEARKREEERKREEDEARKREEEARKREEEEAKRQQEERERRREEEEAKKQKEAEREQEEARRQQEERERKKEEEAEEAKRQKERRREEEAQREQEEARRQQKERERKKEEEEGEEAQREQEEARRQQEKRERKKEEEAERVQEEARRKQEERKKKKEEEAEREKEQARKQHEKRRGEEETQKEQEQARKQQEKRRSREEEEPMREEERGREEGRRRQKRGEKERSREEAAEWEQEEARRQQEERERRREEERRGEREGDNKSMEREVQGQSNWSSFEGRRILKIQNV